MTPEDNGLRTSEAAPTAFRRVSRRLASIRESPTLALQSRARELRAQGRPVISFAAGELDWPTAPDIIEAAQSAAADPVNHRYSASAGQVGLRAAIAEKTLRDSGYEVAFDQITVTNGAKQAIYHGLAAIIDPGDEVIVPAPFWPTYPEAVRLAGGIPVHVSTSLDSGFKATIEQLERARTPRTRALIHCSPSNPTGAVHSLHELEAIGEWALEHGIWVLADEIYEHLVYDDSRHISLPAVVPAIRDRCLIVSGVAKTFAMTGWRIGWLIAPSDIAQAATRHLSQVTSNVNNVAQVAATHALNSDPASVTRIRLKLDSRRQTIVQALRQIEGIDCEPPQGAFFVFPSVRRLLGRTIAGRNIDSSIALATLLLDKVEAAVMPGEVFGSPGHLRFSFALADDEMSEGLRRIGTLLAG